MAQRITVNQNKGSLGAGIVVVCSDVSGFVNFAGANNHISANTAGETISSMFISQIIWSNSHANDKWEIARGANTVFTCYGQNGGIDFKLQNLRLEVGGDSQSNVVFTYTPNGVGHTGNILIKLHKQSGE